MTRLGCWRRRRRFWCKLNRPLPISRNRGFSSAEVVALRLLAHFGRHTAKYNQHLQTKKKTTPQVSHAQS